MQTKMEYFETKSKLLWFTNNSIKNQSRTDTS